jgi:glucuronosyltransferase
MSHSIRYSLFSHRNYVFLSDIDKLMKNYYRNAQLPSAYDLDRKTSLLLVNSNNALDGARENPANVIEVGGLQIRDPKPLPEVSSQFFFEYFFYFLSHLF